jgi:O-antigen ligase
VKAVSPGPAGLSLIAVLLLCVIAPPEVRGAALAAIALFVAVAVAATAETAASSAAGAWVVAAVPLALVAVRTAISPGAAVEPVAVWLLAAFAGIAAGSIGFRSESLAPLFGALLAFVGGRALYETLWGLSAWAARVRASAPMGDTAALLNRMDQGRPYAGFSTPAALGCFLIMTIPAVTAWALGRRGRARAFGLAAAALGGTALVATRSITALAALMAALALAGLRGRVTPRVLAFAGAALGIVALSAGILRPDGVFAPSRADSPWRLRAGNIRIALEIARDHPLAGVGPGGYAEAFPQYRRPGDNESRHAHDLPAELAAEWGAPVGVLFSVLFYWAFVGPLASARGEGRAIDSGLAVGLAAFALHNLADFTAFLPSLLVFAAVSRGLLLKPAAVDRARPGARAAFIAVGLAVAIVAAGAGLARDALFDAREAGSVGDHAEALRLALRAEALAPWDADPPLVAASVRLAAGTGPAATLEDADRAVSRAPSRAAGRAIRARARNQAGDPTGAYSDLVEAARLYPLRAEYAEQRDSLGASLAKAGAAAPR